MSLKNAKVSLMLVIYLFNTALCEEDVTKTVLDNMSWDCANNASCVKSVAKNIVNLYENRKPLNFGLFSVNPVPKIHKITTERSSKIVNFLNGNSIRIPVGPMVFSVQTSEDNPGFLEIALLKRVNAEARGRGGKKEKKNLQVLLPMLIFANSLGWMLLAIKTVAVLTIKALVVSKLAFLVAGGLVIKKLMETAQEKMLLAHYPEHHEHHPFMMPYNMEYTIPSHGIPGADLSAADMYSLHYPHHAAMEHAVAESQLNHAIEQQNATQSQIVAAMNGMGPKVKRDDSQMAAANSRPVIYRYITPNSPAYAYGKI